MGNKSTRKPPRQTRPVNPGQQELAIVRRIMEEAIAARVRVEDQARVLSSRLQEAHMLLAGALLQREDHTIVLVDADLVQLNRFNGFETDRDDEAGTLTLRLSLTDLEVGDEAES
jgi:hypothetical protein